ncbi:MAG: hypothetical protein WBA13_11135 [Microcoleaceae cyanobacterium]
MKKILDFCTFLGVSLAMFFVYAGLNSSGFCFAKMRYLSDEDKFRQEFERLNQPGKVFITDRQNNESGGQRYEYIEYESFEQYIKSNPDCCTMRPFGSDPWDWERITGIHNGEITVMNYVIYYLDENGKRRSRGVKLEAILQNCGQRHYILEPVYLSVILTDESHRMVIFSTQFKAQMSSQYTTLGTIKSW